MKSYTELNNLLAEAFLTPDNFVTDWDNSGNKAYGEQQYQTGLKYGKEYTIIICSNSVWAAEKKGSIITSYEGIGYHARTADLLRGFIDSGAKIVVERRGKSPVVIQERKA